jgi:hypothetical protein
MSSSPVPSSSPRRQRSLSEARALVSAWQASSQSKSSWCRAQGVLETTLQSCLTRVRRADGTGLGSGFIAVCPPRQVMPSVAGELRIDLGGVMQLLGLHLDDVAQVLRALREEVS